MIPEHASALNELAEGGRWIVWRRFVDAAAAARAELADARKRLQEEHDRVRDLETQVAGMKNVIAQVMRYRHQRDVAESQVHAIRQKLLAIVGAHRTRLILEEAKPPLPASPRPIDGLPFSSEPP